MSALLLHDPLVHVPAVLHASARAQIVVSGALGGVLGHPAGRVHVA
ncbi:MAG TPA: hypothetical protein VIY30_12520 [Burkholderiaceae bacterium]